MENLGSHASSDTHGSSKIDRQWGVIYLGIGPLGRGGTRRRTRRRWMSMSSMISTKNKTDIEQASGKRIEDMTDEELEAELKKRGIFPPPQEPE